MDEINAIPNTTVYDLKRSLPNKLLNADGSITDFQGNIITPADEDLAEAYKRTRAIVNKFITEDDEIKTYAEISLEIFVPVDVLPEIGDKNKIYLLPAENGMFDEYFWNNNEKWDKIGEVSIDLSNYPTTEEMHKYVDSQIKDVLGGEY